MDTQNFSQSGDPSDSNLDKMRTFMGPGQIDVQIRQALQMLWTIMPQDKKRVVDVEREFRRLVDRALRDLQVDDEALGSGNSK